MDQKLTNHPSNTLSVSTEVVANSLMHFNAAKADKVKSSAVVELPLELMAQSEHYQELWFDGHEVIDLEFEGLAQVKSLQTEHHLVLVFSAVENSFFDMITQTYQLAYSISAEAGFNYLIRTWNYIDRINVIEDQVERYQTFCVARYQVLEELGQLTAMNPAATAIGGHNGQNSFVFLFSKQTGKVIENKRQVSAWQYPRQYAPKQPRFSRAMQHGDLLLCSGTASVVGHETVHLDDLGAQFDECMVNIQALLEESSLELQIKQGLYRFYLRDKSLLDDILTKIKAYKINHYMVLEGDICRKNLLIECEAVFQSA